MNSVLRPSTGVWYILKSSTNYTTAFSIPRWGDGTYTLVPGDYDGDGKADAAIWHPSTGVWYIRQSSTNYATALSVPGWGDPTDKPIPSHP